MKRFVMGAMVLASALASNAALANADLAKAKNCMACHAVANKLVGPAYKDVAAKYAGQKDAENKLVTKVMKGGSGVGRDPDAGQSAGQRSGSAHAGEMDPDAEMSFCGM
jgi:cytochrome c